MRKMVIVLAIAVIACIPIVGHTQETDTTGSVITVEAKLATGIQDREPVGVGDTFPADVDTVYLWMKVTGAMDTTNIKCIWNYGDEEMAAVDLPVRSPSWRTWSSKAIMPQWTGDWDVKVLDADGNVLKGLTFTIEPAAQTAAPETKPAMQKMEAAKDTASKTMESMKDTASKKTEMMKDTASKAMETMKDTASKMMKDTTQIKEPEGN